MQDLSQLKDIHLPQAISDWPMAYGWWLSLAFIVTIITLSIVVYLKQRNKSAVKRSALALLDRQFTQFKANNDSQLFLQQCNQILKRYCLTHYPEAISLSGPRWTDFLIRHSEKAFFDDHVAYAISQGLYQNHCQYNPEDLYQACVSWIKSNKDIKTVLKTGSKDD